MRATMWAWVSSTRCAATTAQLEHRRGRTNRWHDAAWGHSGLGANNARLEWAKHGCEQTTQTYCLGQSTGAPSRDAWHSNASGFERRALCSSPPPFITESRAPMHEIQTLPVPRCSAGSGSLGGFRLAWSWFRVASCQKCGLVKGCVGVGWVWLGLCRVDGWLVQTLV